MVQALPNKSTSYWHESVEFPTFPKLNEQLNVDVGVVGAGMTGITAAYLLSRQGLNVCLIDAGLILNGTTGNTTAKITAQHGLIYDEFINHFGIEKAKLYYEANNEAKQFIENTIKENDISCQLKEENAYIYTNSDEYKTKLENEYKAYEQLNIDGELTNSVELPYSVKTALKMNNQAHFHPLEYLNAVILLCEKNKVKIFENTRAINVE